MGPGELFHNMIQIFKRFQTNFIIFVNVAKYFTPKIWPSKEQLVVNR